jgi:hypothetical protein
MAPKPPIMGTFKGSSAKPGTTTKDVAAEPPIMGAFKALVFPMFQGAIVLYPPILGGVGGKISRFVRKS